MCQPLAKECAALGNLPNYFSTFESHPYNRSTRNLLRAPSDSDLAAMLTGLECVAHKIAKRYTKNRNGK